MEHFDFRVIAFGCKANDIEFISTGRSDNFLDLPAFYNVDGVGNRQTFHVFQSREDAVGCCLQPFVCLSNHRRGMARGPATPDCHCASQQCYKEFSQVRLGVGALHQVRAASHLMTGLPVSLSRKRAPKIAFSTQGRPDASISRPFGGIEEGSHNQTWDSCYRAVK